MEIFRPADAPERLALPLYGSVVCCGGFSSVADDFVEKTLDLNEYCIDHPTSTYFARARGDSMSPAIDTGDILIIDRSVKPVSRDMVVCLLDGEFAVRRYVEDHRGVWLVADNTKYSARKVTEESDFQVWGTISGIVRRTCRHG